MGLTVKGLAKLTAPGRYRDEHGLYLQVRPEGSRSWLLRYQRAGRERWMGLGPLHAFSLEEARGRARKARQQLSDGIDPLESKRAERAMRAAETAKRLSFEEAAQQYFDANERRWKNDKHRAQFISTLKSYAYPVIGRLPVAAVDTALVLKIIEPIWAEKTETASRVRGRIEIVLDWATVRGHRDGPNPARWRGHLSQVLPARSKIARTVHHAALPYADAGAFMVALRAREGMAARALEFTVLTAARTSEVIGAQWSEIDLDARVWIIPGHRMKAGREHRVPLSAEAVAILRNLPREAGHVFPGPYRGAPMSNMAMAALLRRMDRLDITVHGFRSTFRDWAAERTAYPNHVVEMALAHTIGDKVEAAYRRGDLFEQRRRLAADWAKFCQTTSDAPAASAGANVTAIRSAS